MPNLYGVSNPVANVQFVGLFGGVDLACSAGANTTIFSFTPIIGPSAGIYLPVVAITVSFVAGGTAPTQTTFSGEINGGSVWGTQAPYGGLFTAGVTLQQTFIIPGPPSEIPWRSPGATITIVCNPTGQPITVRSFGSWGTLIVLRAADQ